MLIRFFTKALYDSDDGSGSGGDGAKPTPSSVLAQFNSDALRMAEKLADVLSDNQKQRDELRTLRAQVRDLKDHAVLDGMVALKPDEAAQWDAYRALGEPAEIKRKLTEQEEATAEITRMRRAETIRAAAEAVNFKPSVLAKIAADLPIDVRAVKDGKPIAYVVADGEEKALEDYAKEAWADFLPALRAQPVLAPDINAGARGDGTGATLTKEQRDAATQRYRATF